MQSTCHIQSTCTPVWYQGGQRTSSYAMHLSSSLEESIRRSSSEIECDKCRAAHDMEAHPFGCECTAQSSDCGQTIAEPASL